MDDAGRIRILFVARAYPPTLGGMEQFARQLHTHLARRDDVSVVPLVNRRGKKALPLFLPLMVATGSNLAKRGKIDAIHLADALLAPAGAMLKRISGLPVTASVCGLDVTYANPFYQAFVPPALSRLDALMPISRATERAVRERVGARTRSFVVPLGLNRMARVTNEETQRFRDELHAGAGAHVLLTVGRLIPRKGVAWFVEHVLPELPSNVVYVVIGEGPERTRIAAAAARRGVDDQLRLLGHVDERSLAAAYAGADIFLMPNVHIPGDMEGFGLVALEASGAGLPLLASDIEGIGDAVRDGRNGILVPPSNARAWIDGIRKLLSLEQHELRTLGSKFQATTLADYCWAKTASRYAAIISEVSRRGTSLAGSRT